jgi:hypothetical protein
VMDHVQGTPLVGATPSVAGEKKAEKKVLV